jgi:hypothetical protein
LSTHEPQEQVNRVAALYATAENIAHRSRVPLPTVMKLAVRHAHRTQMGVHEVLTEWSEEMDASRDA